MRRKHEMVNGHPISCWDNGDRVCDRRLDGRDVVFIPKYPKPALLLDVLAGALKARRFDGLFRPGVCACGLDELSPVQCMSESCRPGVLLADATCDNCTKEAPCEFHIGDPPKVCGQPREETA